VGGKQRNLDRPKSEPLEKPLFRIQKSAAAPRDKKQKRQAAATTAAAAESGNSLSTEALFVGLHDGPTLDHPLLDPGSTANEEAWRQGRLLRVGATTYVIEVNPPLVEKLEIHGTPFIGIPVVAVPKLLFSQVEDCIWKWWKQRQSNSTFTDDAEASLKWEEIKGATSQGYTPTEADSGYILRVECTPTRQSTTTSSTISTGIAAMIETSSRVVSPPFPSSSSGRSGLTSTPLHSPSFRIVTYNILADQYASTDAAKTQIFVTCPLENLDPLYRRPLVLDELLQYNADVICLQEVDDKMFQLCLQPALNIAGFDGVYTNKAGKVREGSATFWRRNRFKLLAQRDIALKELFPATCSNEDIKAAKYGPVFEPMLSSSPALCTALQRVATVGQLTLLAPIDNPSSAAADKQALRPLCIANTHLFFHYAAPHIRTMHVWAIIKEACDFAAAAGGGDIAFSSAAAGGKYPALLLCGDLNSDLNDGIPGAIQLLSQGKLSSSYWDWAFGINFKWEKDAEEEEESNGGTNGGCGEENKNTKIASDNNQSNGINGVVNNNIHSSVLSGVNEGGEVQKMLHTEIEHLKPSSPRSPAEKVPGIDLELPFALAAADNLRSNVTNYVRGYEGLLDYIWYQPGRLEVERVIPVPSSDQLGGYIPNKRYPSDHLAVVADLRFSSSNDDGISISNADGGLRGRGLSTNGDGGRKIFGFAGTGDFGDEVTGPGCVLPAGLYNVSVAADILSTQNNTRRAGVIAVPTDTIYGLAACAKEESAVKRIYDIKARAAGKPLAICVADHHDVSRYVETDHLPQGLLEALLPGPLTVLLHKKSDAPIAAALNPGVPTLGVRIPDNKFIRAVCRQHCGALALTSANVSGQKSSLLVEEFKALWPQCEVVFDGGAIPSSRKGSTIVDLTGVGEYRFVRQGEGLEKVVEVLEGTFKLKRKE
jgi:2',5'-phosphodiesterase